MSYEFVSREIQTPRKAKAVLAFSEEGRRPASSGDEFLAVLSHELRTPLHAVLGWVQLLRHDLKPEMRVRALEAIERSARAMSQIVDDLSDQSRIASGKLRLTLQSVDVAGLIRDAVATIRPSAQAKGISLFVRVEDGLPRIEADAGRLLQVLGNLLSNAVKFTGRNGSVDVHASASSTGLRIVVSDTGCGIDPALLPDLFVRYRQGSGATARRHGLGLGLALVKEFVERHGGRVRAESDGPGWGARFIVDLPLEPQRVLVERGAHAPDARSFHEVEGCG